MQGGVELAPCWGLQSQGGFGVRPILPGPADVGLGSRLGVQECSTSTSSQMRHGDTGCPQAGWVPQSDVGSLLCAVLDLCIDCIDFLSL